MSPIPLLISQVATGYFATEDLRAILQGFLTVHSSQCFLQLLITICQVRQTSRTSYQKDFATLLKPGLVYSAATAAMVFTAKPKCFAKAG